MAHQHLQTKASERTAEETDALPPNWSILYTPDGQPYYQNSVTKKTQWEKPSIQPESAPLNQQSQKIPLSVTNEQQPSSSINEQSEALEIDQPQQTKTQDIKNEVISCCEMCQQQWKKWVMGVFVILFVIGGIVLTVASILYSNCPPPDDLCRSFTGAAIGTGVSFIIVGFMGYIITRMTNYSKYDYRCRCCKCPNWCTCDRYMHLQQKQKDVKNCCTQKCKKWTLAVFAVIFVVSGILIITGYAKEPQCDDMLDYSNDAEYEQFSDCRSSATSQYICGFIFIPIGLDGLIISWITYYNKCRCLCCECCDTCDDE